MPPSPFNKRPRPCKEAAAAPIPQGTNCGRGDRGLWGGRKSGSAVPSILSVVLPPMARPRSSHPRRQTE